MTPPSRRTRRRPSGLNCTRESLGAASRSRPEPTSQSRSRPSHPFLASSVPDGWNASSARRCRSASPGSARARPVRRCRERSCWRPPGRLPASSRRGSTRRPRPPRARRCGPGGGSPRRGRQRPWDCPRNRRPISIPSGRYARPVRTPGATSGETGRSPGRGRGPRRRGDGDPSAIGAERDGPAAVVGGGGPDDRGPVDVPDRQRVALGRQISAVGAHSEHPEVSHAYGEPGDLPAVVEASDHDGPVAGPQTA